MKLQNVWHDFYYFKCFISWEVYKEVLLSPWRPCVRPYHWGFSPLTVLVPRRCPHLCLVEDLTGMQLWWLCSFWLKFLLIMFQSMVSGKGFLEITGSRISLIAMAGGIWFIIPHQIEVPADVEGLTLTVLCCKWTLSNDPLNLSQRFPQL